MSKEGVIARQGMLGVVQTAEGLPLCHEVFDGNTSEVQTLKPTLEKIVKRFPVKRVIAVADRGLLSVHHPASLAHALLSGIQNHVRRLLQGPRTPGLQAGVQQRRAAADLRAEDAHLRAHQLLQDLDDFAGRHALHVHLGERQIHGLLRAAAALQGAGIKAVRAHLRHLEGNFAHAGQHGFVLVAVGVIDALGRALIGHSLKVLDTFNAAGFVDQDTKGCTSAVQAIGK